MKVSTHSINAALEIETHSTQGLQDSEANLVLGFGGKKLLEDDKYYHFIKDKFPNAELAICSTSGEIYQDDVYDDTLSISAIQLEKTPIKTTQTNSKDFKDSLEIGKHLYQALKQEDLKYVLVLSDGGTVNGSELVKGLNFENNTLITGGLAGDAARFEETLVGLNQAPASGNILAIGFYGDNIKVSHGSFGGWDEFGMSRTITKSNNNELFEVDNQNILDLYTNYLGKYAEELPGSALLFPLSLETPETDEKVVRTILSVNDETKSLVFAGDMPEGSKVKFMNANFNNLIDAANKATQNATQMLDNKSPKLALLISCVGRKLVLGNRIDEEIEAVQEVVGIDTAVSGFYSYGEISPLVENAACKLHNQTLTITLFDEVS